MKLLVAAANTATAAFAPGIVIPLAPFFGSMGVHVKLPKSVWSGAAH